MVKRLKSSMAFPMLRLPLARSECCYPSLHKFGAKVSLLMEHPPSCMQPVGTGFRRVEEVKMWNPSTTLSESCLRLNIWRPKERSGPLPIMVWIHGREFWSGSAVLDAEEGARLAATGNVILITIAYRLGVLGFFFVV